MASDEFPLLRSHEVMDYKRCRKKWYWRWRRGLVIKARKFGALDLGTWMHGALAIWYEGGLKRAAMPLAHAVATQAELSISVAKANGAPEHELDKASELAMLGEHVAEAYQNHYGDDPDVDVIQAEIPLEFSITDNDGRLIAKHKLKPDMVYRERGTRNVWLMEHKTAGQIRTEHLPIDGQARPYGVMSERALRKLGLLDQRDVFKGVMYNFLRKALPDDRPTDGKGRYLNRNGTVSKRQPGRQFLRHPVVMTRAAKLRALQNLAKDAAEITFMAQSLRNGEVKPENLPITPDKGCPRFCDYFAICSATEQGTDVRSMEQAMYTRRDPYLYEEETTDEPAEW